MAHVANVYYTDPQLSLTIAQDAHNHPGRAFSHFVKSIFSSDHYQFAAENSVKVDDRYSAYVSTAETTPDTLGQHAKTTSTSYCSVHLTEPQCSSENRHNELLQEASGPGQVSEKDHYTRYLVSDPKHNMEPVGTTLPYDEPDSETLASAKTSSPPDGQIEHIVKDIAVIQYETLQPENGSWRAVIPRYFQTLGSMLAHHTIRNTLIITVTFCCIVVYLLQFLSWKAEESTIRKAAEKAATVKAQQDLDDVRHQLQISNNRVKKLRDDKAVMLKAHAEQLGTIDLDRSAEAAKDQLEISKLRNDLGSKQTTIASLLKETEKHKKLTAQLQAGAVEHELREIENLRIANIESNARAFNRAAIEKELSDKAFEVKTQRQTITEMKTQIQERDSEIASKIARIEELDSKFVCKTEEIEKLMLENRAKDEQHVDLEKVAKENVVREAKLKSSTDNLSHQIKEMDAANQKHQETIKGLELKLAQSDTTSKELLEQAQKSALDLQAGLASTEQHLRDVKSLTDDLKAEKSKSEQLDKQYKELQTQSRSMATDISTKAKRIKRLEYQKELDEANLSNTAAQVKVEEARIKELEKKNQDLTAANQQLIKDVNEEKKEVKAHEINDGRVHLKLQNISQSLKDQATRTLELEAANKTLVKDNERLTKEVLEKASRNSELEDAKNNFAVELVSNIDPPQNAPQAQIVRGNTQRPPTAESPTTDDLSGVTALARMLQQECNLPVSAKVVQERINNKQCAICAQPGHLALKCPQHPKNLKPRCDICQQEGHKAKDCPQSPDNAKIQASTTLPVDPVNTKPQTTDPSREKDESSIKASKHAFKDFSPTTKEQIDAVYDKHRWSAEKSTVFAKDIPPPAMQSPPKTAIERAIMDDHTPVGTPPPRRTSAPSSTRREVRPQETVFDGRSSTSKWAKESKQTGRSGNRPPRPNLPAWFVEEERKRKEDEEKKKGKGQEEDKKDE